MNLIKNMEAVFVAALLIVGFSTFATADVARTTAPAAKAATEAKVATVVVSAKRLTAEEKTRLGS